MLKGRDIVIDGFLLVVDFTAWVVVVGDDNDRP